MSAAERARLARAARAVLGAEADAGPARAATLRRVASGAPRGPASLADVRAVPAWLPCGQGERDRFMLAAGLAAVAPDLARVIDGAVLRKFAERAGPDLVDWALGIGRRPDAPDGELPLDGGRLAATGEAVVRTAMPDALAGWFEGDATIPEERARWALDRARERMPA